MTRRRAPGGVLVAGPLAALVAGLVGGLVVAPAAPAAAVEIGQASEDCSNPDDPFILQQSPFLVNTGFPQSWTQATGKGVTVAVVDSGVEVDNRHLGPEVVVEGTALVDGVGIRPDGRTDYLGHGTAIAGLIAGRFLEDENGERLSALVGAAYDATILPVQTFQTEPEFVDQYPPGTTVPTTAKLAEGIRWAVDNGADVINASQSTDANDPDLGLLRSAVEYAHRKDVVVVASAGNTTADEDDPDGLEEPRFPAAFDTVIGVAATNKDGVVDNYTIHGPGTDVAAPGQLVLSTHHVNLGDCLAGTDRPYSSWAAAFVSALAAQLRERYPRADADEIAYRIMASADRPRLGERDDVQGWGTIRPYEALTMTIDPTLPGPPVPGGGKRPRPEAASDVEALAAPTDPWADAREAALWWGLGGVGLTALALILRPMARRRRGAMEA